MSKNEKSELTVALDGEVTAKDLAVGSAAFAQLLEALAAREAPGVQLEWIITDLRPGSSATTARCRPMDPGERHWIPRIIQGGQRFAEQMERDDLQFAQTDALYEVAQTFRGLVRGRLIRVRFESPDKDYILAGSSRAALAAPTFKSIAFGSARGRVQAMSNHGSLRFTLYDLNDDRGISCYLAESEEDQMLGLWGKLVEVEGFIRRDPDSGRPLTIRGIEGITAIPVARPWREAFGAAPGFLGDERSEDIIRRARDE